MHVSLQHVRPDLALYGSHVFVGKTQWCPASLWQQDFSVPQGQCNAG